MKFFKKFLLPIALMLAIMIFAAACGGNDADETEVETPAVTTEDPATQDDDDDDDDVEDVVDAGPAVDPLAAMHAVLENFPTSVQNTNPIIQGGTLRIAEAASSPMSGLLGGAVFSTNATDSAMTDLSGANWSIFSANDSRAFGNTGIASYTVDPVALSMHITLNEHVLWHNGNQLTLDDLLFAYEIIAHPDYVGIRWTAPVQSIVGIWDYHNGDADYISGMVLSDDNMEMTIYFEEMPPSHMHFGIWTAPVPRSEFDGIAVADMHTSAPVLVNPIGWGPFRIVNIVPGEAVHMVRFDDFFDGPAILDGVVKEIIHPDLVPEAMVMGHFDLVGFPLDQFPYYQNPTNFQFVAALVGTYNYTAFRLGTFNSETSRVEQTRDTPLQDVRLRQAMAYAIDQEAITTTLWHGLRFPATSIVTPIHAGFLDTTVPGYPFDPARANQLLDEAGFDQRDAEGYRLDQNGNEMRLIFGIHEAPNNELTALFYIQQWSDIGVRVELYHGRMQEFTSFMDEMREDADGGVVDIMFGNWIPGFNPNPSGRWGGGTNSNFSRYTSAEFDAIFDRLMSPAAWDPAQLQQMYVDLQWYIHENVPMILNNWRVALMAVNNRVSGYSTIISDEVTPFGSSQRWHQIGVTADQPY
ncbi:MAG: ABC transporter substrate-binding protein [Defluviitaleaceae bacterium]|nr:ABC transporter substrate-binding protein [Defluviitaleaceae bacterium]